MTADVVSASDPAAADRVGAVLRAGGVVVLPTDTVYGLAASAADARATATLFERKGRDASVPVAVLCADTDQALALAEHVPAAARELAARHWPGALTLVLPRRTDLGWALGEPAHTIGLRCPDHALVQAVASALGPIATTSANRHGEPTPATALEAAEQLVGPVDLVVDGGPLHGAASTVVDATSDELRVLRAGDVVVDPDA